MSRRNLSYLLIGINLLLLCILFLIYGVYCILSQQGLIYKWTVDTPVERWGIQLGRMMLWKPKQLLLQQLLDQELSKEEKDKLRPLLQKMEQIRPTHMVILKNGSKLYGRLKKRDQKNYDFHFYRQQKFQKLSISEDEIHYKQTLPSSNEDLTPADLRFLLEYADGPFNFFCLHPYLFVTLLDFSEIFELWVRLQEWYNQFRFFFRFLLQSKDEPVGFIRIAILPEYTKINVEGVQDLNAQGNIHLLKQEIRIIGEPRKNTHSFLSEKLDHSSQQLCLFLCHELSHFYLHFFQILDESAPFWLEEGLAQFCGDFLNHRSTQEKIIFLRQQLGSGKWISWDELLAITNTFPSHWNMNMVQLAYAQSWLMVSFFIQNPYRIRFLVYLRDRLYSPQNRGNLSPLLHLANQMQISVAYLQQSLRTWTFQNHLLMEPYLSKEIPEEKK